jgi:hypothetical protein
MLQSLANTAFTSKLVETVQQGFKHSFAPLDAFVEETGQTQAKRSLVFARRIARELQAEARLKGFKSTPYILQDARETSEGLHTQVNVKYRSRLMKNHLEQCNASNITYERLVTSTAPGMHFLPLEVANALTQREEYSDELHIPGLDSTYTVRDNEEITQIRGTGNKEPVTLDSFFDSYDVRTQFKVPVQPSHERYDASRQGSFSVVLESTPNWETFPDAPQTSYIPGGVFVLGNKDIQNRSERLDLSNLASHTTRSSNYQ